MKKLLQWPDALVIGIVFLATLAVNCQPTGGRIRWLSDTHDKDVYIQRGRYVRIADGAPYRTTFSEYPQLATYLFSVPFVLADNRQEYHRIFTWMMAGCLVATCLLARRLCGMLGLSEWRALLVLLPGTLYFSLNRYDIVPALITLAAIWALLKKEIPLAFALLAAGTLMKFYPVLYAPFFAVYVWRQQGWKTAARGAVAFGVVMLLFTAQLVWWVGWTHALSPYLKQGTRVSNTESLFHILSLALPSLQSGGGRLLFYAAQLSPLVALCWLPLRRPEELLRWMTIITMTFVVFLQMQSPQWIAWITPLAALACRTKWELIFAAALDVLAYVYFPLLFDAIGGESGWFTSFIVALTALRFVWIALLARQRQREVVPRLGVTGVQS
jgi:hypothetical protein